MKKKDFELGVGRGGQDTSRHFEGDLGPFVQYCPIKASEQKIGQKPVFSYFGLNFFGDLNQKSASTSICEIHIYIDSESFRQIH